MKNLDKNVKMFYQNISSRKAGFTLVELIIVITILAILATIAFVSFQSYTKDARDANRTATIKNIEKGLELFTIKTGNFPAPDEFSTFTGGLDGKVKINQGIVGDNVARVINMNTIPLDPNDKSKYTYSTFGDDNKYYQVAINAENTQTSFIPQALAYTPISAIVKGNYRFDPSLPSLIVVKDSVNTASGIFDPKVCFVIDGGQNSLTSSSGSCIEKEEMSLKEFDNSLVGYWDMETCTGINGSCGVGEKLKDLSGNGNDGTFSGTLLPTSTGGIIGKSLYFSGGNITINNTIFSNSDFSKGITILGIAYSFSGSKVCDFLYSYGNINFLLNDTIFPKQIRFGDTLNNGINNNFIIDTGIKTFYGGVFNKSLDEESNKKIYMNGMLLNDTVYNGIFSGFSEAYSGSLSYIGTRPGSNCIGIIDDVKIYNRALTDEEIRQQAKIAGF